MDMVIEIQKLLKQAEAAEAQEDWAQAKQLYETILKNDSQHIMARLGLAEMLFFLEDYPGAQKLMAELIQENPTDFNLIQNYALILEQQKVDLTTGLTNLLSKNPDSTAILLALVSIAKDEDVAGARRWFERLLQVPVTNNLDRFNRASAFQMLDDTEAARAELDQMVAGDPENVQVYFDRAQFLAELEDIPGALADFERVSQLEAETSQGYESAAELCFQHGQYDQAIDWYRKASQRAPDDLDLVAAQGVCYEKQGDFASALQIFNKLIDQGPDNPAGYYYRGRVYATQEKIKLAEADYQKVIQLAPDLIPGYIALGSLYLNTEHPQQAIETFLQGIELDPSVAELHNSLGFAYETQTMYEKALQAYQKVIKLATDSPTGYINCGDVYLVMERYLDSIQAYQSALELAPDWPEILAKLGEAHLYNNDPEQAIRYFKRLIEVDSQSTWGYGMLGQAYHTIEQPSAALEACQKALELDPEWSEVYGLMGQIYFNLEQPEAGIAAFREMTVRMPDAPDAFALLGQGYLHTERYPEAFTAFNQLIDLAPRLPDGYQLRAQTYQMLAEADQIPQPAVEDKDQPVTPEKYLELAEQDYLKSIELAGKNTDAYMELAGFYFGCGQLGKALDLVTKIQEWEKDTSRVHFALGLIEENMIENMEALRHYNRAIRLDDTNLDAYAGRGRVYVNLEEYPKALSDLNKVLAEIPDDPQTLTYRAVLWELVNDFSQALADYQAVVRLIPDEVQAQKNLAWILVSLEGYDLAVAAFEQALQCNPDDVEALNGLAYTHYAWASELKVPGQYDLAIQVVDRTLQIDAKNFNAYGVKGCCLLATGKPDDGLVALDRAIELEPTYSWAISEKANALYRLGQLEPALELFQYLKNSIPDFYLEGCVGEVLVYRKQGQLQAAETALQAMLGEAPQAQDYQKRCYAFNNLDDFQQALSDCRRAQELDPNFADAFNMAAWILADDLCTELEEATHLAERGVELAQQELEIASSLDQTDPQNASKLAQKKISLGLVLDTLGWVWYRRGDLEKAEHYLVQGLTYQEQDQLKRNHLEIVRRVLAE